MSHRLEITAYNHVGIRVAERKRSLAFYGALGFKEVWWSEREGVSILRNGADLEINLIVNANDDNGGANVLMDVPVKEPGYTYIALLVSDLDVILSVLENAGVPPTEGPLTYPHGVRAFFVRDPDRNVLEFNQLPDA